jgi:DNA-damage-inducible protein D
MTPEERVESARAAARARWSAAPACTAATDSKSTPSQTGRSVTMTQDAMFQLDGDGPEFEKLAIQNGQDLWNEAEVMAALGYQNEATFQKVIQRAMRACLTLNIPTEDNFKLTELLVDGRPKRQYRLNRFACYLIAMNGDPKKPEIAAAQAYFAKLAEAVQLIQDPTKVDRVIIRAEVSDGTKSLQSTAKQHGVTDFALFQNAGYRGMYSMNFRALLAHRGLSPGDKLFDYMGRDELAANLFRVTQTDLKIRRSGVTGQQALEHVAHGVGKDVRDTMIKIGGVAPERLPKAEPISDVRKELRQTHRLMKKLRTTNTKTADAKALPRGPSKPPGDSTL